MMIKKLFVHMPHAVWLKVLCFLHVCAYVPALCVPNIVYVIA